MGSRLRRIRALFVLAAVACGGGGDGSTAVVTPPVDNTPASITLSASGPQTLASGSTLTIAATVAAKDGHALPSASVAWSSSNPNVATVAAGVVTGVTVGTATITATSGTASASVVIIVVAGPAAKLVMRTQPGAAAVGAPLDPQPVVEIRDAAGNLVTSSNAPVTVSIATGGGTLIGTTTVNAVNGIATFSGLAISGTAGDRTLTFTSPGLAPAVSTVVTITAPPTPVIVVDNATVTVSTPRGTSPAAVRVNVINGGSAPLTGLSVDAPVYDAGNATGWLTATLSSTTAPAVLTLSFNAANLVEGTYHATLRVNAAGATNSPVVIGVTLTVVNNTVVSYGTSAEKVRVVDVGGSFLPTVTVTDAIGTSVAGATVTFVSRANSVATVGSDGRVTARAPGETWIVATAGSTLDSVFVIVPVSSNGPVVRTNITTWSARIADTVFATVVLDTRGTTVGAASIAVDVSAGSSVTYNVPATSPVPTVTAASGVLRIAVGSASGMTGVIPLVNLKIVGRTITSGGWIYMYGLDLSAVDGTNLNAITTSTRLPLVFK